jgi:hypothetical protein
MFPVVYVPTTAPGIVKLSMPADAEYAVDIQLPMMPAVVACPPARLQYKLAEAPTVEVKAIDEGNVTITLFGPLLDVT